MAVIVPPAAVHLPLVAAYLDARMAQVEAMLVRTLDGKGDHIAGKIRSGGSGVWGAIPMPPQTLNEADARLIANWLASGAAR